METIDAFWDPIAPARRSARTRTREGALQEKIIGMFRAPSRIRVPALLRAGAVGSQKAPMVYVCACIYVYDGLHLRLRLHHTIFTHHLINQIKFIYFVN